MGFAWLPLSPSKLLSINNLRKARHNRQKKKNNQIKKITQLEGRIEDLEYDIYMLKLEHTQELHQIERNLNRHLATNTKCVENSKLWTGMERTLSQIAKMSDTALEKSKESTRANKRVNRK